MSPEKTRLYLAVFAAARLIAPEFVSKVLPLMMFSPCLYRNDF